MATFKKKRHLQEYIINDKALTATTHDLQWKGIS